MEENLLKIAEELTTLSQQLLKNNAKILQTITNMEQRHLKMEVYLIALQKKLQEVKKRTPEQEKHLQEITNMRVSEKSRHPLFLLLIFSKIIIFEL